MTSREGDIYDCDRIMRTKINYDIIYDEIVEQSKEESKRWFFWIYESLCRLENFNGIRTPIKKRVFALWTILLIVSLVFENCPLENSDNYSTLCPEFSIVKKHWKERPNDFMDDIANLEGHIPDKKLLKDFRK